VVAAAAAAAGRSQLRQIPRGLGSLLGPPLKLSHAESTLTQPTLVDSRT